MKPEATKIEGDVYELKVPQIVTDDYGNEHTLYRKQVIRASDLGESKATLEKELRDIQEQIDEVEVEDERQTKVEDIK